MKLEPGLAWQFDVEHKVSGGYTLTISARKGSALVELSRRECSTEERALVRLIRSVNKQLEDLGLEASDEQAPG